MENRDWNTTEAYANGIRNGSISDTGMTPSQRQRFQDATLNQLTQPQMNLVSCVLGVGNGVSMDLLESSLRMNADRQDETGRLAQSSLHVIDRLKDEAPVGYQIGYGVGQMIPIYGDGSVAGETVGNVVKQPYLREAAIGALSTAAITVVSGIAQGKPAGQIALETANNAALGSLYGMGLRYLGEVLPQPGTIPYYQMEGRGGFQKKLAPVVGGIAQGLNPNGVIDSFIPADDMIETRNIVGSTYNEYKPTQDRLSFDKVDDYIQKLYQRQRVDPIEVYEVPGKGYYVQEGHHRLAASKLSGYPVDIKILGTSGPIGMDDWQSVKWKAYINDEQFWND